MDKSKSLIADTVSGKEIEQTSNSSKSAYTNARSLRRANVGSVQNFLLVWLDATIDEVNNKDSIHTISKLREVVNTVHTFTNVDECIDFTSDIEEETFMIASGTLGQTTVPIVHDMAQVSAIYIFSANKSQHEQWAQQWPKVKGVFTDIKSICTALQKAVREYDQNNISISLVDTNGDTTNKSLDQLDQSFMYTQILKEILLTIDFKQQHINEFISYYREQFNGNRKELENVDKLQREYLQHMPIWWYTYPCFLYSVLNHALRMMEIDLIISMGFFIQDLHKHISQLHLEQYPGHTRSNSFIVYRGQGLTQTDFNQLMKTKGGLLSFNNFLSTSYDRAVSLTFAESIQYNPNMMGVLFKITVDPSKSSTPFANVRNVSYFQGEEEVLFSMHSIFRIGHIQQINNNNNRLWTVELVLTSDNDSQLHALTEHIRKETFPHAKGWGRLGMLLIKLGQCNKAQEVYDILFDQTTSDGEKAHLYHMLGMIKNGQGEYTQAITYYEKSIKIMQKTLSRTHPYLAASYGNIGLVYNNMGEYSKALSYYEKALEIRQKTLPPNHPDFAQSYNNIGSMYDKIGEYSKALSYYEKALEILQKTLPPNHPSLATSYNNIGGVYGSMGEHSKALSYYEKALEICQITLPPNHPHLATSYNNIGSMYYNMGEYSKALSYYEKALEIFQKTLPQNHPLLAGSYNNIGSVYHNIGDYSKALSYYEKALEIFRKTLPSNHPDLATTYNNIGLVYDNMGEYSKALSYYEKALEIRQKTLPPNHPDLATSYNNIGMVYNTMGEYSKALSYYEKALEIRQKTLPPNHPSLATSYHNIGGVYLNMGDYSKALSFFKHALEIGQRSLPANHPDLQVFKECIEIVKKKL